MSSLQAVGSFLRRVFAGGMTPSADIPPPLIRARLLPVAGTPSTAVWRALVQPQPLNLVLSRADSLRAAFPTVGILNASDINRAGCDALMRKSPRDALT